MPSPDPITVADYFLIIERTQEGITLPGRTYVYAEGLTLIEAREKLKELRATSGNWGSSFTMALEIPQTSESQ